MKQQIVVTNTIRQNEIPALVDWWVKKTPAKILCPEKNFSSQYVILMLVNICRFSLHFLKNTTCL